ncbi:MAG TPA: hypothetical protein VFF31_11405 [Blastocatellia bacterium]|nr:hypothetical protein [Blastocatellia bacterium]
MGPAKSCDNSKNTGAKVIALDQLCKGDKVSVETRRSTYQFSVSDPSRRRGTLSGGALGNQVLDVFLSGTMSEDTTDPDPSELKTGARALFLIELEHHVQLMITSTITDVEVVRGHLGGERAA